MVHLETFDQIEKLKNIFHWIFESFLMNLAGCYDLIKIHLLAK